MSRRKISSDRGMAWWPRRSPASAPRESIPPLKQLPRFFILAAFALLAFASCTELPNDIGVHKHRAVAAVNRFTFGYSPFDSWNDDPAIKGKPKILVNLTTQKAFFYRGNTLVGKSVISSGKQDYDTPPGKYRVIQKDANHVSTEYGAYVSRTGRIVQRDVELGTHPRPRGAHFVGASMPYFLRFRAGYGMHAGYVPHHRASHGCIRLPMEIARHFFEASKIGTRVEVIEPPP